MGHLKNFTTSRAAVLVLVLLSLICLCAILFFATGRPNGGEIQSADQAWQRGDYLGSVAQYMRAHVRARDLQVRYIVIRQFEEAITRPLIRDGQYDAALRHCPLLYRIGGPYNNAEAPLATSCLNAQEFKQYDDRCQTQCTSDCRQLHAMGIVINSCK